MMTKLNPIWKTGLLYLMSLLILLAPHRANAQASFELRCTPFDPTTVVTGPIPDFPGVYYHTIRIGSIGPEYRWEFGLITASGQRIIEAPFSPDLAQRITFPRVSPDGAKMVFFPLTGTEIVVWNIATGETASLALTQELADYLMQYDSYSIRTFNKLTWSSPSELTLQYFPEFGWDIANPAFRISMTVSERPLQIRMQTAIPSADLASIQTSVSLVTVASPGGRYQANVNVGEVTIPYTRPFQVLDTLTNQVVFQATSSESAQIVSGPIWSSDSSRILFLELTPAGAQLVEISVNQSFKRDTRLNDLLVSQFGAATGIDRIMVSPDGLYLSFGYLQQSTNNYYMMRYDMQSGNLIAVCDEFPSNEGRYPFWSPAGHRFAAYWYGAIKVYDFETGNRYLLPGNSFVGWIESKS